MEDMLEEEDDDEFNVQYSIVKYLFETQKRCQLMEKYIFKKEENVNLAQIFEDWRFNDLPEISTSIYIKQLEIDEMYVSFSFHPSFISEPDSFHLLNTVASVLGTAIGNIDDAPIKIGKYEKKEYFDSQNGLKMSLIKNYKFQAIGQGILVAGSLDIIGNPRRLAYKFIDGFSDFMEKPLEGIQQGPLEFGIGISEGTSSLFKNGISGTFQSINKMTGTISTGLSKFTMDQQYQERRRRFMLKQPQNAIDGLEQAGVFLYKGFQDGLTGIVTQPIEGAEKDGVTGFLLGTVKGLTGAIVKPITGILDATSKTAEGLSNTVTHFDDKSNDQRNRHPRCFYDYMGYYKRYSNYDSLFRIQSLYSQKLRGIHIIDCVKISNDQYLGISREKIVQFNCQKLKIIQIIDPNNIDDDIPILSKNVQSIIESKRTISEDNISSSLKQLNQIPYSPIQLNKRNTYQVTITYYNTDEIVNIKSSPSSIQKTGNIYVTFDSEERAEQFVQKLKMIKHKNELDNFKLNVEGSEYGIPSPMKQESHQSHKS